MGEVKKPLETSSFFQLDRLLLFKKICETQGQHALLTLAAANILLKKLTFNGHRSITFHGITAMGFVCMA